MRTAGGRRPCQVRRNRCAENVQDRHERVCAARELGVTVPHEAGAILAMHPEVAQPFCKCCGEQLVPALWRTPYGVQCD